MSGIHTFTMFTVWSCLGVVLVSSPVINAFDWVQQPGTVRACIHGKARFPWKYDANKYTVNMVYWKYVGTGDTVIAHHISPVNEVIHYFDRYKMRTFLLEDANAGFLMKDVTKADVGQYAVELSGYSDGIDRAMLEVYTDEELTPDMRVDNVPIEPGSTIERVQGKVVSFSINTDLLGNLVIDAGKVTSCLNETLCTATLTLSPESKVETRVRFAVNNHICKPHDQYVIIKKTVPVVPPVEDATTEAAVPIVTSSTTTVIVIVVVFAVLVLVAVVLAVLCVVWRRRQDRRLELTPCQKDYIDCIYVCVHPPPDPDSSKIELNEAETDPLKVEKQPTTTTKPTTDITKPTTDTTKPTTDITKPTTDTPSDTKKPTTDTPSDITKPTTDTPSDTKKPTTDTPSDITKPTTDTPSDITKPTTDTPSDITKSTPEERPPPGYQQPPGDKTYQCGQLTLEVKKGDLTEQRVDAIVNSTVDSLIFNGAVANSILRKGGYGIKTECQELVSSQGPVERAAMTGSGTLPCKNIIHLNTQSARTWGQKVLDVLELAKAKHLTSVALPAFGTGQINQIPSNQIAPAMYKGVREFSGSDIGSVRNVSIVAYEAGTRDEFVRHIDEVHGNISYAVPPAADDLSAAAAAKTPSPKRGNRAEYALNNVTFFLKKGDLTTWRCDVIVNGTNSQFSSAGAVSRSILNKGGYQIQTQCQQLFDDHGPMDKVAYTDSGRLPCGGIIHMDTQDSRGWDDSVYDVLVLAEQKQLKSVAFPAFGTGKLNNIPPSIMAPLMYGGVRRFAEDYPHSSVKEVTIVVFVQEDLELFLEDTGNAHLSKGPLKAPVDRTVRDSQTDTPHEEQSPGALTDTPHEEQSPGADMSQVIPSTGGATAEADEADETEPLLQDEKVVWKYKAALGEVEYPAARSRQIEAAYQQKDATVSWTDGLDSYTITFADMEEVDNVTGLSVKVLRV